MHVIIIIIIIIIIIKILCKINDMHKYAVTPLHSVTTYYSYFYISSRTKLSHIVQKVSQIFARHISFRSWRTASKHWRINTELN